MKSLSVKLTVIILTCLIPSLTQASLQKRTTPSYKVTPEIIAMEAEILNLTNKERKKAGLAALTLNNHLKEVAQEQSVSMAHHHHLSHSVKGKNFATRIKESGYPYRRVGENVARSRRSAPHVVQMWMKSHGHRVNILNPEFKEIGIGIVAVPNGDRFFTQVYGTRR